VGIYKDRKTLVSVNRYKLAPGISKLSIPVNEIPYKVVLDPRLLLIDKKLEDNEFKLAKDEKGSDKAVKKSSVKVRRG